MGIAKCKVSVYLSVLNLSLQHMYTIVITKNNAKSRSIKLCIISRIFIMQAKKYQKCNSIKWVEISITIWERLMTSQGIMIWYRISTLSLDKSRYWKLGFYLIGSKGIRLSQLLKISHCVNKTCSTLKSKENMYIHWTL